MPPPPTAATESLRVNFWKGKRLYLCIYFDLFFFWRIDDRMGLDGERQKQHRHSGRVGARPDQFDGRRHSAGTLQHFTCPLFHRWVDFVFFLFGFDHFWRWHLVDRRQPQHPAAGKFLRQGDDVAPVPPWHHLRGCRPAGAVQRRHHLLLIAGIHQVRACNWRHVQYYSSFPPPSGVAIPPYSSRLWRLYFEQRPIKVTITIYGARAQAGTTRIDWIASLTAYHSLP